MSPHRFRFWPAGIFVLLGMNFVVVGITVYAAVTTRTPVERDYYQRALHFDDNAQQRRMNQSLGWRLEATLRARAPEPSVLPQPPREPPNSDADSTPSLSKVPSSASTPTLHTMLTDSEGKPIRSAQIGVEAVYESDPGVRFEGELVEVAPGEYAAAIPIDRSGLWRMSLIASASGVTFTDEQLFNVRSLSDPQTPGVRSAH